MTRTKPPKVAKKTPFLQTYSSVRPYGRTELDQIFKDMKSEMKAPGAAGFFNAASSIGTHAPKLAAPRNKTRALLLNAGGGNRPAALAASGNGALAPYMKVLLRPILILDEPGETSLFDRVQRGGDHTLLDAFETVFGRDARIALMNGLATRTGVQDISVGHENYPVFFIPGENGADLQASPGGSIEAHTNMKTLMDQMASAAKKNREEGIASTYGEWSILSFADKAQNVVVGAPINRTRFRASFPDVLSQLEADLWRYRRTGQFPRLRDRNAAACLVDFAFEVKRFNKRDTYRGGDIEERLVGNRAKFMILRARQFFDDICQALSAFGVADTDLPELDIRAILSQLNVRTALDARPDATREDASFVIASLRTPEFASALKKYGI